MSQNESSKRGPLPRPAVALTENRYASPADILHALLASGWTWVELVAGTKHSKLDIVANCDMIVLTRDGFEYIINPEVLNWQIVLGVMQEYGYYIGREYRRQFGPSVDVERVH